MKTLWRFSNARVRVMPPIDYSGSTLSAAEVTAHLQQRFADWTGWRIAAPDEPNA